MDIDKIDWKALTQNEDYLNLEALMNPHDVEAENVSVIGTFRDSDEILCELVLQKAKRFGIVAYRWIVNSPDSPDWDHCAWQISREDVVQDAQDVIYRCDKNTSHLPPKPKESTEEQLILSILATHWFEEYVDASYIEAILSYAMGRPYDTDLIIFRQGGCGSVLNHAQYDDEDSVFVIKQDSRNSYSIAIREAIEKRQGEILSTVR